MRHHESSMTTATAEPSGCRRCHRNYWNALPACPYCGATNAQEQDSSALTIDPRTRMNNFGSGFYYFFIALSIICGILIILHDIFLNILDYTSYSFLAWQLRLKVLFWIIYPVMQIMFAIWIYQEHNSLSNLKVRKKYGSWLAISIFIPILNLYFPKALISEFEDTLYNLKVRNLNIRFIGVWWFFQAIAYLYLTVAGFLPNDEVTFVIIIIVELLWGVALLMQSIMLHNFQVSMEGRNMSHGHAASSSGSTGHSVGHGHRH